MWTSLHYLACLLPLSSFLLSTTAAVIGTNPSLVNPTSLNENSLRKHSPNNTTLGAVDPTKIEIRPRYYDSKLPVTSVLMTVMDTMVKFALWNWDDEVDPGVYFIDSPRYSDVEILVSAPGLRGKIPISYAILGLFNVMANILTDPTQRFKESSTSIIYDGREVGWVEVRKRVRRPNTISKDFDKADISSVDKANLTTNLATPAWEDPHLEVEITYGRDALTIFEAFFAVYAMIRQTAINASKIPLSASLVDFSVNINAPPITTLNHPIMSSFKNHDSPARTARNPPYFQPKWLIKALGQLPQTMMDARSFKVINWMTIKVDGIPVGDGFLLRQGRSLGASLGVAATF